MKRMTGDVLSRRREEASFVLALVVNPNDYDTEITNSIEERVTYTVLNDT